MKIIFTCASYGQLVHSSWEIPVLFTVITIVTGVQIDTVGIERVVFGTDYPCPMEIVDAVNWVNGLESLTENEKEAILSNNPAQMLSL